MRLHRTNLGTSNFRPGEIQILSVFPHLPKYTLQTCSAYSLSTQNPNQFKAPGAQVSRDHCAGGKVIFWFK